MSHIGRFKLQHTPTSPARLTIQKFTKWTCWTTYREQCMICDFDGLLSATYEVTLVWDDGNTEYIREVCCDCMDRLKIDYAIPAGEDKVIDDRHRIKTVKSTLTISPDAVAYILQISREHGSISQPVTFNISLYGVQNGEKRSVHRIIHPVNRIYKCHIDIGIQRDLIAPYVDEYGYHYSGMGDYINYGPSVDKNPVKCDEPITSIIAEYNYRGNDKILGRRVVPISTVTARWKPDHEYVDYLISVVLNKLELTMVSH
jgi:hypothetical protein